MSEPAVLPSAPAVVPAVIMCDEPGCTELATVAYTWPWGVSGHVCARHQFLRQQTARNMKRQIMFTPLGAQHAPPVEREERIALHAARLTAEDERDQAKGRTAVLLQQNQALVSEVSTLRSRFDQLTAAHESLRTHTAELGKAFDDLQVVAAQRADEIVRLQTVVDALEAHIQDPERVPLAVPVDEPTTSR